MTWWMYILGGLIVLVVGYGIGFWYADGMIKHGQSSFVNKGNKGKIKGNIYFPVPPTSKPSRRVPSPKPLSGVQHNTTVPNKPKGQAPTNLPINLNINESEENNE